MFNKLASHKSVSLTLIAVLVFHFVGNLVWIVNNTNPPSWDEAYHIRHSMQFTQFFWSIFRGSPDWAWAWDAFQDGYGPLMRILMGIVMSIFGTHIVVTQIISTLFFLATILAVYALARELSKKPWIAVVAASVFSFYQLVYAHSRWPLLDIPVTFFTTLSFYHLLKSEFGIIRKNSVYAAIFAALAGLTKAQAVSYFVIPAVYTLYLNYRKKTFAQTSQNLFTALVVAVILFGLWAVPNFTTMYEYVKAGTTIKLNHPDNLLLPQTWTFYLKIFINNISTLWGFFLLLPAMYFYIRRTISEHKLFVGVMIFGYYLWFTLISNKDLRFYYPLLPFVAYVFAEGWNTIVEILTIRGHKIARVALASLFALFAAFQVLMYLTLSYGNVLTGDVKSFVMVPGVDDITILNTESDYPVKKVSKDVWPQKTIVNDIREHFIDTSKETKIFLIPNFEYLNHNSLTLELTRQNIRHVQFHGGIGKEMFISQKELAEFVSQFDHFFYVEGEFGPEYQWDRELFAQVQAELEKMAKQNKLTVLKKYSLPNGKTVFWLRSKS